MKQRQPPDGSTEHGQVQSHLAYFLALVLLTGSLLGYFLLHTHARQAEAINASCANEARVIASQFDSTLRRIDASTSRMAEEFRPALEAGVHDEARRHQVNLRMAGQGRHFPELSGFYVFDRSGHLLYASRPESAPFDISDRAYFKAQQAHPRPGLYFSETLVSRLTGQRILAAHRAVLDDAGRFLGVVVGTLALPHFERAFSGLDVGAAGMVSIRRSDDSRLVVRWPIVEEEINLPAVRTPPFQRIQSGSVEGVVRYIGKTDKVDRTFAYHKTGAYPFYVLVGRGTDEQFRDWYWMAAISTLLTVAGLGLVGLFISRLQRSQKHLRNSEQRFRDLVFTLADWIWEVDAEGRYSYASVKVEAVLGYTPAEMIGLTPFDFMAPEEAERVRPLFADIVSRREPFSRLEIIVLDKEGGAHVILTSGTPIFSDKGQWLGYRGTDTDITEAKRLSDEVAAYQQNLEVMVQQRTAELEAANRQLKVSDLRLKAMFEMSQAAHALDERALLQRGIEEAVRLTGSEIGYLHFVNPDQETIELYTWSEGTLKYCTAAYDSHYPVAQAGIWADSVRTRLPALHNDYQNLPVKHGSPEGHAHLVRHLGVPILEEGKVRVLFGVGNKAVDYDDSDIHQLQLIGEDLWRIVMRRRAEIELAKAKHEAEAASRAKSAFLANMSHEIRTPMNGILGMAAILRRNGVTPAQARQLDKIDAAGRHLMQVINDILDLSKIEAGKLVLEQRDFTLAEVLHGIVAVVGEQVHNKGLKMMIRTSALPQALHGDPTRLAQALVNYLGNAVKFTAQGSITLTGHVLEESETGYLLRFEVIDTGIGMDGEQLTRLFQAFEQADSTTTRRYGGTGLGLSITRHIARLMGGETGVSSAPGQGSTFWLTVRLGKGQAAPEADAVGQADDAETALRQQHAGKWVLLAEDEPINQEVARMLLEDVDIALDIANDGLEALEKARSKPYDLILMDMQMPKMDGLAASQAIRQLPGYARTPILAMTANAFEEDRKRCLDAGMNDFIAKPIDTAQFFGLLNTWLSQTSEPTE